MKKKQTVHSSGPPKIVTLDIETAPIESYTWGLFEQTVGVDQIKTEWSVLSFCAKSLGGKPVYYDTGGRGPGKVRDDKELLGKLWKILDECDIVVAQNGASFDVKRVNARFLIHGFKPYSPIKVIDTMLSARRHFGFTSNKLAWLSEHLTDVPKSVHKKYPGFSLWLACLSDDKNAWREMEKYNTVDVIATEKLYLTLRPWISNHPNVAAYNDTEVMACPKCGSTHVQKRGKSFTQVGVYIRFQCQDCGGWSRSRQAVNTKEKRATLLTT